MFVVKVANKRIYILLYALWRIIMYAYQYILNYYNQYNIIYLCTISIDVRLFE